MKDPTYQDVCDDTTGHAEVVQISFDSNIVTYRTLLDLFWRSHNPTTLNRQGPDVGTQYRSVIFTHSEEQREGALQSKMEREASGVWKQPIVTQIIPAMTFYRAEEYHQQYFQKHGGTCHV